MAKCCYAECHNAEFCYAESRKQFLYAECRYAECRYAGCHYAGCHYAWCRYAECRHAECRYAECRYTEGHGAVLAGMSVLNGIRTPHLDLELKTSPGFILLT